MKDVKVSLSSSQTNWHCNRKVKGRKKWLQPGRVAQGRAGIELAQGGCNSCFSRGKDATGVTFRAGFKLLSSWSGDWARVLK